MTEKEKFCKKFLKKKWNFFVKNEELVEGELEQRIRRSVLDVDQVLAGSDRIPSDPTVVRRRITIFRLGFDRFEAPECDLQDWKNNDGTLQKKDHCGGLRSFHQKQRVKFLFENNFLWKYFLKLADCLQICLKTTMRLFRKRPLWLIAELSSKITGLIFVWKLNFYENIF